MITMCTLRRRLSGNLCLFQVNSSVNGEGIMRTKLLNIFMALTIVLSMFAVAKPASAAGPIKPMTTITFTNNPATDWNGIPPVITEVGDMNGQFGANSPDIANVYVASDAANVYFMID